MTKVSSRLPPGSSCLAALVQSDHWTVGSRGDRNSQPPSAGHLPWKASQMKLMSNSFFWNSDPSMTGCEAEWRLASEYMAAENAPVSFFFCSKDPSGQLALSRWAGGTRWSHHIKGLGLSFASSKIQFARSLRGDDFSRELRCTN